MKLNKKASIIASSVAAIALSSSLLVGSTYALFTSESKVDISVKSAKVRVSAKVDDKSVYTKKLYDAEWTAGVGGTYAQGIKFNDNSIELNLLVPGDEVKFDIIVENTSSIDVKYRTKLLVGADDGLFGGLDVTINETSYSGMTMVDNWALLTAESNPAKVTVTIALPEDAGNEYNGKNTTISYFVEAVQGNAPVQDENADVVAIYTEHDLRALAADVNSGTSYYGKTVKLMNDIDLKGKEWTPIGTSSAPFLGVFDGQGNTISNLSVTSGRDYAGLFGFAGKPDQAKRSVIKDVTVNNANVKGNLYASVILGNAYVCDISNINVTGDVHLSGYWYIGSVCGYGYSNIENCRVDVNDGSAIDATGAYIGGIKGFSGEGSFILANCYSNIDVSGLSYVGGISGMAHYGNTIRECEVDGVTVTKTVTAAEADQSDMYGYGAIAGITVDNASPILIENCTGSATLITHCGEINNDGIVGLNRNGVAANNLTLTNNNVTLTKLEFIGSAPSSVALNNNTVIIKDVPDHKAQIEVSGVGTLVLENVNVNPTAEGSSALKLADNANVTLQIKGECVLKGAKNGDGITVPATANLDLSGDKLTAIGNNGLEYDSKFTNYNNTTDDNYKGTKGGGIFIAGTANIHDVKSLTAEGYGTGFDRAVGIGGTTSKLVIKETTIEFARGGMAQATPFTDMKYSNEAEGCPAIGTLTGGTVTLNGVTVKSARGGAKSAAIGGVCHQSVTVEIDGCNLTDIVGGNCSAAIGGGRVNRDREHTISVTISDSTISAQGGYFGAGIGSGYDTDCSGKTKTNIVITGNSDITAVGGKYCAGIGAGYHIGHLTGHIDATVDTTGVKANEENWYKKEYTTAQNIGYSVCDPTREYANEEITFTIGGVVIDTPKTGPKE